MSAAGLIGAFAVGLLGSGHCIAMCGGISAALDVAAAPRSGSRVFQRLGYQAGRLAGYAIAGAVAGGIGAGLFRWALVEGEAEGALATARGIQALMLILLGLYLAGLWRAPLAAIERQGARLWRALEPLRRRVLPVRGFSGALRMGLLWGFLPCGLVYSALILALAAGSAGAGGLTMLAFGAGTLPAVVLTGIAGTRLADLAADSAVRRGAGVVLVASGVLLAVAAAFPIAFMAHVM